MHKRSLFILTMGLSLTFILISLAFAADETLTITTYYPSPYGSYNELQLYPHSSPVTTCNATTRGTMYYDSDDGQIHVCDGASWPSIGGGGGWTDDGTVVRLTTSTDNVGIGMLIPTSKLYVSGSSGTSGAISINTNGQSQLELLKNGVQKWAVVSTDNYPSGDNFGLYNFSRSSIPFFITASNDNVGIGTTSPGAKLDIQTAVPAQGTYQSQWWSTNNAGYGLKLQTVWDATGIYQKFVNRFNSTDYDTMTFKSGNVGIGTTSPGAKLDVAPGNYVYLVSHLIGTDQIEMGHRQSGNHYSFIDFRGDDTYTDFGLRILRGNSGANTWSELTHHGTGDLIIGTVEGAALKLRTWGADRLTILSNGYVGIGTSPAQKLDVAGELRYQAGGTTIRMSGVYPAYYEFIQSESTAWGVSKWASSKRFKENITDLEIDSSKIYDLNPVSFNWKPDRGGQRDFGIIAEQAAKILPLLVAYDKEGKPFSVKYDLLSVLLLKELKKKATEINALNETVEQLKTRIEKLEQGI